MRDAVHQRGRLAGAGAGDDEQRAVAVRGGGKLLGVELDEHGRTPVRILPAGYHVGVDGWGGRSGTCGLEVSDSGRRDGQRRTAVRVDRRSGARPRATYPTARDLSGDERLADRKGGADELTERVVASGFEGKRDGV